MHYQLVIDSGDIEAVRKVYKEYMSHPIVEGRLERNTAFPIPQLNNEDIWQAQIMCLLTTQNKSGTGSAVDVFLQTQPFPLSLEECQTSKEFDELITSTFSRLRIRRWKISAGFLQQNFLILEQGGWGKLELWRDQLLEQRITKAEPTHYLFEREVAQGTQELLRGFGPKQSRNFWQDLGLFRYEIPLDSRITRWLKSRLEFYVPSSGLADERFYCQVMDVVRELAINADLLPCILDAAIFASYEQ